MHRVLACLWAMFIFGLVFSILDFIAIHMLEPFSTAAQTGGCCFCVLVAFLLARVLYLSGIAKQREYKSGRVYWW